MVQQIIHVEKYAFGIQRHDSIVPPSGGCVKVR